MNAFAITMLDPPTCCVSCGQPFSAVFAFMRRKVVVKKRGEIAPDQTLAYAEAGDRAMDISAVFDALNIRSICCRAHLATAIEWK